MFLPRQIFPILSYLIFVDGFSLNSSPAFRSCSQSNLSFVRSTLHQKGHNVNSIQLLFPRNGKLNKKLFANEQEVDEIDKELRDASEMKVKEIKTELKERGVSFADCFDRESLTKRLQEARANPIPPTPNPEASEVSPNKNPETEQTPKKDDDNNKSKSKVSTSFDRESTLQDLRKLRVSELRSQLGSRKIRWANMIEKEELVVALANAMEKSAAFSPSGMLAPGVVTDITDEELSLELDNSSQLPPFLLDVYATWCGPCQMMAPELDKAAMELGDTVRIAKLDSDKYTNWASKLKVGGLPTLILFDQNGKEVDRIEGAIRKDDLVAFAKKAI